MVDNSTIVDTWKLDKLLDSQLQLRMMLTSMLAVQGQTVDVKQTWAVCEGADNSIVPTFVVEECNGLQSNKGALNSGADSSTAPNLVVNELQSKDSEEAPFASGSSFGERVTKQAKLLHSITKAIFHEPTTPSEPAMEYRVRQLPRFCNGGNSRLVKLVDHSIFNVALNTVILFNTIFMAYEVEVNRAKLGELPSEEMALINAILTSIFLFELLLRLAAFRFSFFVGADAGWNILDFVCVVSGMLDLVPMLFFPPPPESEPESPTAGGKNVAFLRVLRVLRMLKMLKLFRALRAFRDLRIIVHSMVASVRASFWAIALIGMITFVFALAFMSGATAYLENEAESKSWAREGIYADWPSVYGSMITLFAAATGGHNWSVFTRTLYEMGNFYHNLFLFYITFFMFVVTNILTSLFVDHAMKAANTDESSLIADQMQQKNEHRRKVAQIFESMQKDEHGNVSVEEFRSHMEDKRMIAFAARLDVETSDILQFFIALTGDGKSALDIDMFVLGCIKLRGSAKSVDLMHCLMQQQRINFEQDKFHTYCKKRFTDISKSMQTSIQAMNALCQQLPYHTSSMVLQPRQTECELPITFSHEVLPDLDST